MVVILPRLAQGLAVLAFFGHAVLGDTDLGYGDLDTSLPQSLDGANGYPVAGGPPGSIPDTGKTRKYKFSVSRQMRNVDGGGSKSVLLVNGKFPGPMIEANWGDTIQVKVTNNIQSQAEGVSLHWHGQPQRLSPFYDGTPTITQCPIAPGSSQTYTFRAEAYGTSWWHSHVSGQLNDGLYGPMVIYGPKSAKYDVDLGPVITADYSREDYYSILKGVYSKPPVFPIVNNNLINGHAIANCSSTDKSCNPYGDLSKYHFRKGKTHRLRLINAGWAGSQKFTIDGHKMTVIANDYVPVQPYDTDYVTLGIGQRTDVLVKGTGSGAYFMRSDVDQPCANLTYGNTHAFALIYYDAADKHQIPNTTATPWQSNGCLNDPLSKTVPFYPQAPPPAPAITQYFNFSFGPNVTGTNVWQVNGSAYKGDYNKPLLFDAVKGNNSWPKERNVYNFGSADSIRVVMLNYKPFAHPMHLHGHNFYVLAEGYGSWDGSIQANPSNPQRRDTHLMAPSNPDGRPWYTVIEWEADNPGIWPLHCHTSIHASFGLFLNILERPDLVSKQLKIPQPIQAVCDTWNKWTQSNFVDQIDSGVKIKERVKHRMRR